MKADFEYLNQLKILICNLMLSIRKDDDHGYCKSFGHGNLRNDVRIYFEINQTGVCSTCDYDNRFSDP